MSLGKIITLDRMILNVDAFNIRSYKELSKQWNDLSLLKNSGELIGSVTYSGEVPSFESNSHDKNTKSYLSIDVPLSFESGNEYSFDFYIKLYSDCSIGKQTILGNGGINKNFILDYKGDGNWDILFRNSDSVYINCASISNYDIISNWCNIVFTVNNSIAIIYINGIKVKETKLLKSDIIISRIMGGYEYNSVFQSLQGYLSNIRIYNKELTIEEIQQNIDVLGWRYVK